jgi:hypothetical protein
MSSTPIQREPAPDVPKPSNSLRFTISGLLLVTAGVAAALALVTQLEVFGLAIVLTAAGLAAIWSGRKKWEGGGFGIPMGVICLMVAGFLFLGTLIRPVELQSSCHNNLKQIAIALHNYHDTFGSLPPAYVADENGRPMHSWRVLLLPFIEHKALYDEYRFDEPWDGPHNRQLADYMPSVYRCPSDPGANPRLPISSYLAVVGPETIWPGGQTRFGTMSKTARAKRCSSSNRTIPASTGWNREICTPGRWLVKSIRRTARESAVATVPSGNWPRPHSRTGACEL